MASATGNSSGTGGAGSGVAGEGVAVALAGSPDGSPSLAKAPPEAGFLALIAVLEAAATAAAGDSCEAAGCGVGRLRFVVGATTFPTDGELFASCAFLRASISACSFAIFAFSAALGSSGSGAACEK